jgi:FtsH-binding integral membrane protein
MDEFSYLSVLISVILGLAVTQILKGFRGILLSRVRVRIYWPVILWAGLLLLVCFQHWWAMFGMRHRHDWTFQQFGMVLLNVIFIYMVAGLVLPDFFGEQVVDLKENFYAHRGWFFSLAVGVIVVSVGKSLVLDGRLLPPTDLVFHAIFGVGLLIGALTRSERYHKGLVVFTSALFVCYIVLLYARIQ